jgi:hypothetical protein
MQPGKVDQRAAGSRRAGACRTMGRCTAGKMQRILATYFSRRAKWNMAVFVLSLPVILA